MDIDIDIIDIGSFVFMCLTYRTACGSSEKSEVSKLRYT